MERILRIVFQWSLLVGVVKSAGSMNSCCNKFVHLEYSHFILIADPWDTNQAYKQSSVHSNVILL